MQSDPEEEYEEILLKARAPMRAIRWRATRRRSGARSRAHEERVRDRADIGRR